MNFGNVAAEPGTLGTGIMVAVELQLERLSVGVVGGTIWKGTAWNVPRKKKTRKRMGKTPRTNALRWREAATRVVNVIRGRTVRERLQWTGGEQGVHVASIPCQGLGITRLWGTHNCGHAQRNRAGVAPHMDPPRQPIDGGPDVQPKDVLEHQEGVEQRHYLRTQ